MNWFSFLPNLFKSGKEVVEVFKENEEAKGQRGHIERLSDMEIDRSVLSQFSSEFHNRNSRTKWDSFIDGLNRLPRPILTFSVIGFFVLAPINPELFTEIAMAYKVIPNGYWALLSVIIGFYFGGRMQLKQADFDVQKQHVDAAKQLMTMRREFREFQNEEDKPSEADYTDAVKKGHSRMENKVVSNWRASQN
ncbi:MAG: holin family protein [Agarilytica sp.]